jgi:prepilin-type N-terminal cleavage/methylation domain-containing protein
MREKPAFTLVELLVVISIIALLLAVLMPALQKAKYLAGRAVCMNSVRQQVLFQLQYATEFGGKFPSHKTSEAYVVKQPGDVDDNGKPITNAADVTTPRGEDVWVAYHPYIKTGSRIFVCPLTKKFATEETAPNQWWGMCGNQSWYNPAWRSPSGSLGGWDAVMPGTNNTPPAYIFIPYYWFANFDPRHAGDPPIDFQTYGEAPWPTKLAECGSRNAMVAHIVGEAANHPGKFRDMGHGQNSSVNWQKLTSFKSADNPVGYGDGHVVLNAVRSNTIPRKVIYTTGGVTCTICY